MLNIQRQPVTGIQRNPITENKFPSPIKEWINSEFGSLHTIQFHNQIWIIGREVAHILGYQHPIKDITTHVSKENKMVMSYKQWREILGITKDTDSVLLRYTSPRGLTLINEMGLYSLIFHSRMPKAQEFARWVCDEVLPSIRKHGTYMTPEVLDQVIQNPQVAQDLITQLKVEHENNLKLKTKIKELIPKAQYTDGVLKSDELLPISRIAKEFGVTSFVMNRVLNKFQVQYQTRAHGSWYMRDKYTAQNWSQPYTASYSKGTKHHSNTYLRWTQQGRLGIHNLLAEHGFKPICMLTPEQTANQIKQLKAIIK